MSENPSTRVGNSSKGVMPAEAIFTEMAEIVREAAAGPGTLNDTVEAQLSRAARYLGISFRRARAYRHGEVRSVSAQEADRLRQKRTQLLRDREARLDAELEIVRLRISRLERGV